MKTAFYVESYGRQVGRKGFDRQDQRDLGCRRQQDQRHQGFKYLCKT